MAEQNQTPTETERTLYSEDFGAQNTYVELVVDMSPDLDERSTLVTFEVHGCGDPMTLAEARAFHAALGRLLATAEAEGLA